MCELTPLSLPTLADIRSAADRWDDLWVRSTLTHPTGRAELIADWFECFSDPDSFRGLVVCHGNRFVGALPLIRRRKGRLLNCADLPGNEWASAGQLLLDPNYNMHAVCDCLIDSLTRLDCSAAWFASLPLNAPWWRTFAAAARRKGQRVASRDRYKVGQLRIGGDWQRLQATWSKGLRRQMRRTLRQLGREGELTLRCERPRNAEDALRHLKLGLQLEQAGWKGRAASSILANEFAHRYVLRQAGRLACWGQLQLSFLEYNGRPIAFEYGWVAKNVYHSYKVTYDERYRRNSPGQLLLYQLQRRFIDDGSVHTIDFLGPLDQAIARWHPTTYSMGRLLVAPRSPVGCALTLASTVGAR